MRHAGVPSIFSIIRVWSLSPSHVPAASFELGHFTSAPAQPLWPTYDGLAIALFFLPTIGQLIR